MARLVLDIELGLRSSDAFVLDGFGEAETHHRWAIGRTSRLRLPITDRGQPHVVMLDMQPWLHPPEVTRQRIILGINGRFPETFALTHRTAIALRVPADQATGDEVIVSIDSLDAGANAGIDTYRNGSAMNVLMVSARLFVVADCPAAPIVELPPVAVPVGRRGNLLSGFESLGHRCAFGLLQQRWHVEQLGLLRFTGIHTPILVRELLRGFDGLGDESDLEAFIRDDSCGLYSIYDRVREMWFNTSQLIATTPPQRVTALAARRLAFLRRKFMEDLGSGHRIFVVNSPHVLHEAEALALSTTLNLFARNTLLWTNQTGNLPPGTVRQTAPGLYFGQLDRAGQVEGDPSDEAWLSVCENVRRLVTGYDQVARSH